MLFASIVSEKILASEQHILYISDENYLHPTFVSMASILKNYQPVDGDSISFHIAYTQDAPESDLQHAARKYAITGINPEVKYSIDFIPVADLYNSKPVFDPYGWHQSIYFKLYASEILPNIDKCLYLDGDIMCNGNIREIFEYPLDEGTYIGGFDYFSDRINAGVLLMDLTAMRRERFIEEAEEILRKGQEAAKRKPEKEQERNIFAEEHCLMTLFKGGFGTKFPEKFNKKIGAISKQGKIQEDEPLIVHFLSRRSKPWRYDKRTLRNGSGKKWPFARWPIIGEKGWFSYCDLVAITE
jgi:lipopolysaccharide biosynthesis glycosyltransferase